MDELTVVTWRIPRVDAAALERATFPQAARTDPLHVLRTRSGARELVHVPTCQRVVYALLHAHDDAPERLVEAYRELGRPLPEPEVFRGRDAFHHLCETASSLDSLVVGEPQVLGQYKASVRESEEAGLTNGGMRHVFNLVFRAAKAVRSETELFRGKVSLVPLTEEVLERHLQDKAAPRAVVFGTGQIGQRMAQMLREKRPDVQLTLVSRTPERAREAAAEFGATPLTLTEYLDAPPEEVDVLALAMRADTPFVDAHRLRAHAAKRPVLVLDLALPRNTAAPDAAVENLQLVQLDDLARESEARKAERALEVEPARRVLDRELTRISEEYEQRVLHRQLAQLDERFRVVMEERWAALPASVAGDDAAARKWFEQSVRALLHEATTAVKNAGCKRRDP